MARARPKRWPGDFNPSRLTLARRRRGLSQIALAEALNVTRLTIYRYETGESDPPGEALERLSGVLRFPVSFFFGPDIDEPNQHSASFRGLTSMTARERDGALAAGALAFLLDDWIRPRVASAPEIDIPDLRGEHPEIAARALRQKWLLGERPIKNMIHLLESKGVRVFALAEETRNVDAFSVWRNDKPYVFLNTMKTAERSRMDSAHELAHLLLHKHGGPRGKSVEEEANKFARSFLMPEADVKAVLPTVSNVQQIVYTKRRWGVSATNLSYRLHKLGNISDWLYQRYAIQLTELGYRTDEPNGMPPEKSLFWQKVFDGLRSKGMTKHTIAEALSLPVVEIENLVFRLANMMSFDGGALTSSKSRASLKVVKG
jgi:Zn-dependent peptidase ImmA (M78 family)/DNA-binding XRE family transcriptional regulator